MINFLLGAFIGMTIVNLTVLVYIFITNNEYNGAIIGIGIYYWIIKGICFIIEQIRNFVIRHFQVMVVLTYSFLDKESGYYSRDCRIFFRDWKRNLKKYEVNISKVFNLDDKERCKGYFRVETAKENENIIYKRNLKSLDNYDQNIVKKFFECIENQKS